MRDKVFLLQAPIATPTEPPVGISQLAGYVRSCGLDLTIADLNMALFDGLMTPTAVRRCRARAERQLATIDQSGRLGGRDLLAYVPLLQYASLQRLEERIAGAVQVFRDPELFFDHGAYLDAARAVKTMLGLASATIFPFSIDFADVSSALHNFDRSSELYQGIDDFCRIEDNLVLEILEQALDRTFAHHRPQLVGISITYAHQFFLGMLLARLVRRRFPEVYLALGGPLVATMANRGRKAGSYTLFQDADAVAVSDGEHAFRTLIEHVLAGREVPPIPNLITWNRRTGTGGVPEINVVEDLDTLPCPSFDGLPVHSYWTPSPVLPLPIARGCYWDKCTFCFYGFVPDGRRATAPYRERSVEHIVGDIQALKQQFGCSHFDFTVDLVAPTLLDRLATALPAAGLDVKWMLEARAERTFTRERCRKLKAGGMTYAAFGLESSDQAVLDAIDKGTKVAQYAKALGNFHDEGIATHAMGFFDFPNEDHQAALNSVDFLKENDHHLSEVGWGRFTLDLGSHLHRNAEQYGIEVVVDEQEDLATSAWHAQRQRRKTSEQDEALEALFEQYRLTFDKFSILGRPFLGGGSLEPHCLLAFGRVGVNATADFTRFVKTRLAAEFSDADRLQLAISALRVRFPMKRLYQVFSSVRKELSDEKAGPIVAFGKRPSKSERLRRVDERDEIPAPGDPRLVLATPDQIIEVSEAQWSVLSSFASATRVQAVLDDYPENRSQVRTLIGRALSYGWLEPVREARP